ncbi:unnamed protein product [Linum trigynum]|uniref:Uncharacterized protein n=1 Tax=Linum trigynum TaxID=586398 RepID=A0AAV2CCG6_9ROSI
MEEGQDGGGAGKTMVGDGRRRGEEEVTTGGFRRVGGCGEEEVTAGSGGFRWGVGGCGEEDGRVFDGRGVFGGGGGNKNRLLRV